MLKNNSGNEEASSVDDTDDVELLDRDFQRLYVEHEKKQKNKIKN